MEEIDAHCKGDGDASGNCYSEKQPAWEKFAKLKSSVGSPDYEGCEGGACVAKEIHGDVVRISPFS